MPRGSNLTPEMRAKAVAVKRLRGTTNQFTKGTANTASEAARHAKIAQTIKGTKRAKEATAKMRDTNADKLRREMEENLEELPPGFFTTYGDEDDFVDF